jgi:DNA-binding CsgD family transcriptional regulator
MFIHDALGRLDDALTHARSIADDQPDLVPGQAILMYQLQRSGRTAEARAILETLADDDFRLVTRDEDWLMILVLLGLTVAELGERAVAARIYDLIRPHAHICAVIGNGAVWLGPVERPLGLLASVLGRHDTAVAHLEAAAQIAARANARPLLASIQTDLASALIAAGTGTARHPNGLTEREVEVLRLIAGGCTNREIADALVLSVRTVERHIAHIYSKTNARGRADATRYAVRHHLIPDTAPV